MTGPSKTCSVEHRPARPTVLTWVLCSLVALVLATTGAIDVPAAAAAAASRVATTPTSAESKPAQQYDRDSRATATTHTANARPRAFHSYDETRNVSGTRTLVSGYRRAAKAGDDAAVRLLGPGTSFGSKIEGQLGKRGWTKRLVDSAINDPARTVPWRDTRHLPGGAGRMDDPATAYYSRRGGYVVRNERTGDVVQVSNRTKPGWKAPWDP